MKFMIVVAFFALVAVAFAEKPVAAGPAEIEKSVAPVKAEDSKEVRDKRGLLVTSYATAPISAPIAYASYPAPVAYPYAYSAGIRYPSTYVANYPLTYVL